MCPYCGEPVTDPDLWVVKGRTYCSRDCASQASGRL